MGVGWHLWLPLFSIPAPGDEIVLQRAINKHLSFIINKKKLFCQNEALAPGQGFPASQFSLERWTEYMVKLILD